MTPAETPQRINRWIDRLAPPHLAEEIQGDMYEMFIKDIREKGMRAARARYNLNGLGFLFRRFFWKREHTVENNSNTLIMIGSYIKMARRSLLFYKGNTLINTFGLVVGIASAIILLTMIHYELSFDQFHSDTDRIYRLVRVTAPPGQINEESERRTGVSYPVPAALRAEVPGIEQLSPVMFYNNVQIVAVDKKGVELKFMEDTGGAFAGPEFFKIFDFKGKGFKWIEGNPEASLTAPYSIVLTKALADKYFPNGNALGGVLKIEKELDVKVTGIVSDLPAETDLPFTMFISYSTWLEIKKGQMDNWVSVDDGHNVFVKLAPGVTQQGVEAQIGKVHAAHTYKDLSESRNYLLQPIGEMHFDPRFGNYNGRTISKETVLALELIGLFLILTASINYINLATAQSSLRSKEIGVRKVMGSNRGNLVFQFMTETFIVVLIAAMAGLLLAEIALPSMKGLLNLKLNSYLFTNMFTWISLGVMVVAVTLLAGFYPSIVIAGFNPLAAIRNSMSTSATGGISVRKLLVVAQFTITQVLVVGTFIVISQMKFFENRELGFNKDAIITFSIPERNIDKVNILKNQLKQEAFVSEVSFSSTLPSGSNRSSNFSDIARAESVDDKDYRGAEFQHGDENYADLYQIKLIAGRKLVLADTNARILITRNLAKDLGYATPDDAVGQKVKNGDRKFIIAGVLEDFYTASLKDKIGSTVIFISPKRARFAGIKLNLSEGQSVTEITQRIAKIWSALYPESVFEYAFLDDNIKNFYEQEEKYATLFQIFSGIFLFIGCLGLYGLITFVVNRKGKEVAIRKVLGAKMSNVLVMFSKEYVRLVLISFIIAAPVAWYGTNQWLNTFAQRISLQWWLFVIPGGLVLTIAVLVVISKSFKAAIANPVDALRAE